MVHRCWSPFWWWWWWWLLAGKGRHKWNNECTWHAAEGCLCPFWCLWECYLLNLLCHNSSTHLHTNHFNGKVTVITDRPNWASSWQSHRWIVENAGFNTWSCLTVPQFVCRVWPRRGGGPISTTELNVSQAETEYPLGETVFHQGKALISAQFIRKSLCVSCLPSFLPYELCAKYSFSLAKKQVKTCSELASCKAMHKVMTHMRHTNLWHFDDIVLLPGALQCLYRNRWHQQQCVPYILS